MTSNPFDMPAQAIDVEVFPNFFQIGALDFDSGEVRQWSTEPGIGGTLAEARTWYAAVRDKALFLGFNSAAYDNHLLAAVLEDGVEDPAALYQISQAIIQNPRARPARVAVGGALSIDLLAIHGGQNARVGSLKELGCKLGYPHLQELPYAFDATLDPAQMREVARYNCHDLAITHATARLSAEMINARFALATEYCLPEILNRHDAAVAVSVLGKALFQHSKPRWYPYTRWACQGSRFTAGFRYRTQALQDLLERVAGWEMSFELEVTTAAGGDTEKRITGPKFADAVTVDDVTYRLGVGGLHSDDGPGIWEANADYQLLDFDVGSFYPALILNYGLVPSHLPRQAFLATFGALRDKRIQAKQDGQKALAAGLKIAINSTFGKFKSPYSWLCDPIMSVAVTILGQLSLLCFIDALADCDGVDVISVNTDGFTVKARRDVAAIVIAGMHQQAASMNLELDVTEYRRLARRDVNNYCALALDDKVKGRGAYGYDLGNLAKKATNRIVVDAAQAHLLNGTPVAQTIRAGTDLTAFIDYFKCSRGYRIVAAADGGDHGTIARWYRGTNGVHLDKVKLADGSKTQLAESGAVVIDELPAEMPADLDHAAYEADAAKLVAAVEDPPQAAPAWTLALSELSAAQHARHRRNMTTRVADAAAVAAADLTQAHKNYAAMHRGNKYDSMKAIAVALWCAGRGGLTQGDLLEMLRQVDAADGYFAGSRKRNLEDIAEWVSREISPWPAPRTVAEHIARAATWAVETVQPVKRPKKTLRHRGVVDSDWISGLALRKFGKTREIYGLACAICAVAAKHAKPIDQARVAGLIDEVAAYVDAQETDPATTTEGDTHPDDAAEPAAIIATEEPVVA